MEVLTEAGLTVQQMAASMSRVFGLCQCLGADEPLPWGMLPQETRERWLKAAWEGGDILAEMDGQPFPEVAERLASIHSPAPDGDERPYKALPLEARVACEAVARRLAQVLEEDLGQDDLPALEATWPEWARKRFPRVETK